MHTGAMSETLAANQLVAYNLMRIRKALGLSQEQAAERLAKYLGVRWSKAVYSAAERSYSSKRVRQFTADDLTALSLAFGVPVIYFWMPPKPEDRDAVAGMATNGHTLAWHELFRVMLGGQPAAIVSRLDELPTEDGPPDSVREVLNLLALTGAGMSYRRVSVSDPHVYPPGEAGGESE
jgi:transcriptional regulator with XRE-family HTH domain